MLFSTPLALPTLSVFASLVRSAAIPISLDAPPTGTVELLPYNAAMPGASPSYTPKAPAAILPVADIIPFLGATDFDPDSILGQVAAGLSGLGDNAQTLVGLSNVDLAAILGGRQALAKRQLCGLFGNCPVATTSKPATTSAAPTSTPVATTTQAPANNGLCGLFGNCPKAGTTTTPVATTTSTPSTSVAPSSTSGFATSVRTTVSPTSSSPSSSSRTTTSTAAVPTSTVTCLGAGTSESTINTLFNKGGANTVVYLCPSTVISIQNPIQFTQTNQTLMTRGAPTDSTRATIKVMGLSQTNAILSSCTACSGVALRNVQVDGSRPLLGFISSSLGGSALLEMGGSNSGQIIDNVNAFEPRSWSTLHAMEGTANSCSGMLITNNRLGPSGQGPSKPSNQLQGEWADSLSLACKASTVTGNTLVDATDGAIIIFGAPNSLIKGNTILAQTRQLMGGINLVDFNPFSGSFAGVVVAENTFDASGSFIKIGIPMGLSTWGSQNSTTYSTGATVRDNLFTSSGTGAFGWAIAVAGHADAVISGNSFRNANFGGMPSSGCTAAKPPTPQPLIFDPSITRNIAYNQQGFTAQTIQLLICEAPSTTYAMKGFTATY